MDFRKAAPDLKVRVGDVLSEGNKVVSTWEISDTFKHDYNGIKGTRKKSNLRGVDLFKINTHEKSLITRRLKVWMEKDDQRTIVGRVNRHDK